ncbi:MAG: TetR/AcrR family transcriptional regulator [Acutalibacteraceae bacterium]
MDNKEAMIQATVALIEEKGERLDEITVREICKRAGVGLGLVNYHFKSKEALIELCVERIINGIVERFQAIGETTQGLTPLEKLDALGSMTFTFLFEHDAVSKVSIIGDMRAPKANDNTGRTYAAYLPLVAACRPDWDEDTVKQKTFCLIAVMQQAFLRRDAVWQTLGVDLTNEEERRAFHKQILHNILEV